MNDKIFIVIAAGALAWLGKEILKVLLPPGVTVR